MTSNKTTQSPELTLIGTEKQVAWAIKIREKILNALSAWDAILDEADNLTDKEVPVLMGKRMSCVSGAWQQPLYTDIASSRTPVREKIRLCRLFLEGIRAEPSARWWIDHRDSSLETIIEHRRSDYTKLPADEMSPEELSVIDEMTVRPENAVSKQAAHLIINEFNLYTSINGYNYAFNRAIIPGSKFNAATKDFELINRDANGDIMDRAAEQIHRLLLAGFPVYCSNETALKKGVAGDYIPMHPRWLMYSRRKNYAMLRYDYDEELIKELEKLEGRRSISKKYGRYFLWLENWEMARYLQQEFNFKIESSVEQMLKHNEAVQAGQLVNVTARPDPTLIPPAWSREQATGRIDDEFVDDDE